MVLHQIFFSAAAPATDLERVSRQLVFRTTREDKKSIRGCLVFRD
jgi:hypothetical protein